MECKLMEKILQDNYCHISSYSCGKCSDTAIFIVKLVLVNLYLFCCMILSVYSTWKMIIQEIISTAAGKF